MDGLYRFDGLFIKTVYLYGKLRYELTINVKNLVAHR